METKDFKFRIDDIDEEKGKFTGMASVYDVVDTYNETVLKGAFRKTLKENEGKFPLCWFHNVTEPLGIIHAKDKKTSLEVEGHLNLDVQSAKEKRSLMRQGAISGLSIGFRTLQDEWDKNIRKLKEIKLYEISLITRNFQACPGAEVTDVKEGLPDEFKPYPNEHSARLKDPASFDPDSFRRKNDGTIYGKIKVPSTVAVIWGKLKGSSDPEDNPIPQALRFPVKNWTVAEAKAWLKENNVKYQKFEPASKSLEGVLDRVLSIESADNISNESMRLIKQSITHLENFCPVSEPGSSTRKPESIYSSVIEALKKDHNKPQSHLYGSMIKILGKS